MRILRIKFLTTIIVILVIIFACLHCCNVTFGIITIAFPAPNVVAQRYFEAVTRGDKNTILNLTTDKGLCHDLTVKMAREHIAQFSGQEVKAIDISTGYWENQPTDFSPARIQYATVEFEYRETRSAAWEKAKIRFTIIQSGWRFVVCGPPG